jgi:hypothetical protein
MNLARPIEYFVQIRWTVLISFEWLLPLIGFRATESGINRCVFSFFVIVLTLVFVVLWPAIAVPDFGGARVAGTIASTSQPAILSHTEAGHECSKSCHRLRLFLTKVSSEPFVADAMFKGREGFGVRTVDDLILFN